MFLFGAIVCAIVRAGDVDVTIVDVMTAGDASADCVEKPCAYKAFRIPGLVAIGDDVLLAYAEGRKTGCSDFAGVHDLVQKRSTDSGKTWGPLRTLIDAVHFWPNVTANKSPETGNAIWDPTPVYDESTKELFVFFNGPGREQDILNGQTWFGRSKDMGDTWIWTNATLSCQRQGEGGPGTRSANTPGGGHGVQLSTGRLVIPKYAGTPFGVSICYSDDHGDTWHASPTFYGELSWTEVEIAELTRKGGADGKTPVLYMTIRNDEFGASYPQGGRQMSTSTDGGLTWSPQENVQVPDPNCKGGIVQWKGHPGGLIMSTAGSCTARANQTVYVSTKDGAPGSWTHWQQISSKSGYSTLQMTGVGGNTIANLFEKNTCNISIGLLDANAMIAEPAKGYVSCASSHCGGPHNRGGGSAAVPPSTPPNTSTGFCVGPPPKPPPPPSAACQKAINALCSDPVGNKECVAPTVHAYPNAQPFVAAFDAGCAVEPKILKPVPEGPCQTVNAVKSWKCYSHLAMDAASGKWSNSATHPNAYCSGYAAKVEAILAKC